MTRHVCDNCGAAVADEQFCPSCGAWINPLQEEETVQEEGFEEFSLEEGPPAAFDQPPVRVPRPEIQCPSCGSNNPANNRHCEECGARLSQGSLPVAPRPAVQATAGVRAAMMIASILGVVVVAAVLFNLFTGDDETTDTTDPATAESTTTTTVPVGPIDILSANCSVSGLAGLGCGNLIDAGEGEYQFNWEELTEGQDVTIELILPEPMVVQGIEWENLPADDEGFFQNYRARGITIADDDPNAIPVPFNLEDSPGSQLVEYVALRTFKVVIQINTVYFPQERNSQVFTELAIRGIRVIGYPAGVPDATTTTTTEATQG